MFYNILILRFISLSTAAAFVALSSCSYMYVATVLSSYCGGSFCGPTVRFFAGWFAAIAIVVVVAIVGVLIGVDVVVIVVVYVGFTIYYIVLRI